MNQNFSRLFLMLALISVSAQSSAREPIELKIKPTDPKGYLIEEVEAGVFEVTTNPDRAVIPFEPLRMAVPEGIAVLSFDYFCATGMEFMVVTVNNDLSRIEENMIRVPIAEGWSTFSVDISERLGSLQNPDDFLSIEIFPNAARPTVMRVKNPHLRTYTEKEKEQVRDQLAREEREQRLNAGIEKYMAADFTCKVESVAVYKNEVEISGNTGKQSGELFLCEVPMFAELTEMDFLTVIPVEGENFSIRVERCASHEGMTYDRLYSRWVVAAFSQEGYTLLSAARYADQVEAMHDIPCEVVRNKKGIGGINLNGHQSDVDSFDIGSVTINIWLGFVSVNPGEDVIPHQYNGRTYYMDRQQIEKYDRTLRFTSSRNLIVSAIILIMPQRGMSDTETGGLLEHPDFNAAGIYSMPDMTNLESLNVYAAAIDFLSSRYMQPGNPYGRIHHWIAHNEVDAGWVWTNAGIKTPLRFMDIYLKSMRLLYYTGRKYDPNCEVFITLTHYWQARHNEYCYPSARLLEILLDYTEREGDFKWGVAHHPYPQSLFEPKTWLDDEATFDYQTPLITFRNLEVLDAWIRHPRTFYKGTEKRTLYLSEQNPNSKDYSEEALREQAASMAYVMKKLSACTGIDAYQMHNWIDNREEGGLRIGVRRFSDDPTEPYGRKPAWFVFEAYDTDREDQVFEFAKDVIGINDWKEIIHTDPIPIPLDRK